MKSLNSVSTILFLLISFGAKLSAQKNLLELIPRDALFVAHLNASDIDKKLSWQKIGDYGFFEELLNKSLTKLEIEQKAFLSDLVKNPAEKGINFPSTLYMFAETAEDKKYINLLLPLSDASKFKASALEFFAEDFNSRLMAKGSYLSYINKYNTAVIWQKNHALLSIIIADKEFDEGDEAYQTRMMLSLDAYVDKMVNISPEKSYYSHDTYIQWSKGVRDAGIWGNYKEIMQLNLQNDGYASIFSGNSLSFINNLTETFLNAYGDINVGSDISFEKGEILSNSTVYCGEDIMNFSRSATENSANKKILKYIDGKQAGMYFIMATSPKGVYEGWKNLLAEKAGPYKSSVDDLFGIMEIFIDEKDAFNFLKGDVFFSYNGLKTVEKTETEYEYNKENDEYEPVERKIKQQIPLISFGFSYGNKEDMLKFIKLINRSGFLKKEKKDLYRLFIPFSNEAFFIKMDKGLMVISNDEQRLLQNKKYRQLDKAHNKYLKDDFLTFYINPAAFADIIMSINPPADFKSFIKDFKSAVGDITLHSYRPKKGDRQLRQDFIIDLKNKEENALKKCFDYLNQLYLKTLKSI